MTAAAFVMAAVPKVTADPQAVAGFNAIGLGVAGMYVIGLLEIIGAVALLVPLLCGLARMAFVGLMIGTVLTTLLVFGPQLVVIPAAVLVLAAIIAWGRRRSVTRLIALIRKNIPR
ncbi:MAG: DoxX family protein [Pseudonocardiaceae bacterium]